MMFLVGLLREPFSNPLSKLSFYWSSFYWGHLRRDFLFSRCLPFPLEDRVPPTEKEKQTSHQIFLLHISAKSEYYKLATIKGTSLELALHIFLECTHLLAFLSNPSLSFLTLQSLGRHPREQVSGGTGWTRLSLDKSQRQSVSGLSGAF